MKFQISDDGFQTTEAHQVLIVSYGRSGSSFVGDLLQAYPGAVYTFEPLFLFDNATKDVSLNVSYI